MDRYAVVGHPVEHSKSPYIHARFAAQTGERLSYDRLLVPLDGFLPAVREFAAGGARGCNITVPFKFEAFAAAGRRSERASLAGAANLLSFEGEQWYADNTDGAGLVRDLQHNAGFELAGRQLLLIGAGGAAAGVLGPLLEARPRRLVLANRTVAKAEALVQQHAALARSAGVELQAAGLDHCGEGHQLVINASASSLAGAAVPVPARVLAPGALAYDMMYGPAARGFLDWAEAHGATGRDGLGMLVEQAAEAFAVWRGVRPDTAPVLAALRTEQG
ncbi:shikimate dehydrogenase [Aquabacterium sp. A7-Y]|uniref:shikimate dehydrogenase n=1 Tax=Aquabacterium sp. A7-Y TaxID=1349605 RepID=UPI00223D3136|nr:shikimate dehydrogenase [Aquabacterium sp. A7-Y]MCW7537451.1 shikimate dehydrogenase [Aquabacterium sp. A7-Y]